MSTILKSLKKLEQEKEATRYPVHAGPGAVAASGGPSQWTKSTWIRRSIVAILILGLGATSLYFYNQSQGQPSAVPAPPEATQPPDKKIAKGRVEKQPQQKPAQTRPRPMAKVQENRPKKIQEPVRRPVVPPAPRQSPVTRQSEKALPPVLPDKRPVPTAEPMPIRKPSPPPAERLPLPTRVPQRRQPANPGQKRMPIPVVPSENQPSPAKSQTTVRSAPQKNAQPQDTYDSVRPLTDGRLKVHAIVWSDNHEDRMAVINTQILHEGDTVSGFSIVSIREDDVVVRGEGGGLHKVIFGRP